MRQSALRRITQFHPEDPDKLSRELSSHEDAVDSAITSVSAATQPRLAPTNTKTAAYTALVGELVICNGSFPVTIPVAKPSNAGLRVGVVVGVGSAITVRSASGLTQGEAGDSLFAPGRYEYMSDGVGWWRDATPQLPMQATWFGVMGDGVFLTDVVTTAGSAAISSPSAGLANATNGMSILLRTANAVASGTVSSAGATLTGAGTNVAVDMPIIVNMGGGIGQPLSGGCIYCDGQWLVASFVLTATEQLQLRRAPSPAIVAKPYYTETQLSATLSSVSATGATLSTAATVSQTGVLASCATDSTEALRNAIQTTYDLGFKVLELPAGALGHSANLLFSNMSGLTIRGKGISKTWLQDMRRASTYYTSGPSGALSFDDTCSDIHLEDFSYDGSVPVLGMVHSSIPGVGNASGRRIGFWMQGCENSSYRVGGGILIGPGFYGARDEHAYIDGQTDGFTDDSEIIGVNSVCFNCNGGFNGAGNAQPERLLVRGKYSGLLISAGSAILDNVDISPGGVDIEGAVTLDLIGHVLMNGGLIHDFSMEQSVGMIDVFGNNVADSSLVIKNVTFARNTSVAFHSGGGAACVHLNNFGGVCDISGITAMDNESTTTGGRHIYIEGSSTGKIHIGPSNFAGGTNLTIGVQVASGVPAGAVTIAPGSKYGSSITTRWNILNTGGLGRLDHMITVSATGTTAVPMSCDYVLVTANGAVTVTLPDPTLRGDRPITVKNSTTQAGTTTVGTAAGDIDGAASVARTGASRSVTLRPDGTNWKVEALYL